MGRRPAVADAVHGDGQGLSIRRDHTQIIGQDLAALLEVRFDRPAIRALRGDGVVGRVARVDRVLPVVVAAVGERAYRAVRQRPGRGDRGPVAIGLVGPGLRFGGGPRGIRGLREIQLLRAEPGIRLGRAELHRDHHRRQHRADKDQSLHHPAPSIN